MRGPSAGPASDEPEAPGVLVSDEPTAGSGPRSFMEDRTLLSVYGRSFGVAPILGMLGELQSLDEMQQAVQPWVEGFSAVTDSRPITLAPHLLYALARRCHDDGDTCLIFLDASGVDIVAEYIEPTEERGMAVILDVQIGRMTPLSLVRRMIDAGYLAYPHVHVALDPEFATQPGQYHPGDPIGQLPADPINQAQELLSEYALDENLPVCKALIVHQFVDARTNHWSMIPDKQNIQRFPGVEVVINADGFGSPDAKVWKYNAMTDPEEYPSLPWRGIKIFQYNRHAPRFSDNPVLTPRQVYGIDPTPAGRRMWAGPHLIVLA